MIARRLVVAITVVACSVTSVFADPWDVNDGSSSSPNVLWPSASPQRHDLAASGGVPDLDFMRVSVAPFRSYEVVINNSNLDWLNTRTLERLNSVSSAVLQSGAPADSNSFLRQVRWVSSSFEENLIKVTGTTIDNAGSFYEITLRETTLYCPRFNNSGGQLSVLILQRAGMERSAACDGTTFFFNEDQALLGQQALTLGPNNDVNVYSLPGVAGLAGQRGGAQIAHTCGLGGIKAKLVALEPATGFSFDTPCTVREF